PSLRLAIDKAKADNMPNDNIERAIKKATGTLEGSNFEEVTYEGYGPGGVAVIVHSLTDNRNRTAAEVRHAFNKNDGNLGESGSVSFMFDRKGYIVIINEDGVIDEDEVTLAAIEAGVEDMCVEEDATVKKAKIIIIPKSYSKIDKENEEKMLQLLDMLEENEDVQDVHHNLEFSE